MGNRDKPEEEPPFVRGNLRFLSVSDDEIGSGQQTKGVDCGKGDSPQTECAGGFCVDVFQIRQRSFHLVSNSLPGFPKAL